MLTCLPIAITVQIKGAKKSCLSGLHQVFSQVLKNILNFYMMSFFMQFRLYLRFIFIM